MAGDIISRKTRHEFREYFVGTSLRAIEKAFDEADVRCDSDYQPPCGGQRRTLVEQYYHSVDFANWRDVRKVLKVYAAELQRIEDHIADHPQYDMTEAKRPLASLTRMLEREGFKYENGGITHEGHVASLPMVHEAAKALDVPELHRQLVRLRDAPDEDPGLAIGTAKELVETTCKTILHARGMTFNEHADIVDLVKTVRKELKLLAEDVPSAAKGAETMKRLLANLGTIAQGLGELRNLYGTGHGKTGSAKGLSARHARLAVGSAATLATFLLETHEERETSGGTS
jgi:hypothetical protein